MSRTIQVIIVTVVVVGLGILLFATGDNQTNNNLDNDTSTTTERNANIPTDWETYVSDEFDFTIAHPAEASVQIEGPENRHTKFTYLGPDNEEGTEITDGFTITVSSYSKVDTTATTPQEFANQRIEENPIAEVIESPTNTTFHGRSAATYETESVGADIEHIVTETESAFIQVSTSVADPNNAGYANMTDTMKASLVLQEQENNQPASVSEVSIALLNVDIPEGQEPDRGCDLVEVVSRDIEATPAPLTAAMEELFSLESENVAGHSNFIARTNDTLSFDRAAVEDGTAHIYLTGQLSGLRGVCDNPRAMIQIEETALQFATVDDVQLYLNGEATELQPSGQ